MTDGGQDETYDIDLIEPIVDFYVGIFDRDLFKRELVKVRDEVRARRAAVEAARAAAVGESTPAG